jgi:hypothetical protein
VSDGGIPLHEIGEVQVRIDDIVNLPKQPETLGKFKDWQLIQTIRVMTAEFERRKSVGAEAEGT